MGHLPLPLSRPLPLPPLLSRHRGCHALLDTDVYYVVKGLRDNMVRLHGPFSCKEHLPFDNRSNGTKKQENTQNSVASQTKMLYVTEIPYPEGTRLCSPVQQDC